jgi:Uncharacterised protein family (UPF0164)
VKNKSIGIWNLIIGLFLLTASGNAHATDKKAGTSGAQFLKIGAGARPTAMGDAFVGIADDVNAVYYNPAGLANISNPELTAMHTQWLQGLNYDFGAFAYPTDFGAFAFSAATLKVDDLQKRSVDEGDQGTFESLDAAYGLTYSKNITPLLSLGLTGRYIHEELDTAKATSWSGDIGVLKRFVNRPITIGLAMRHMGPGIKFINETDPLPTTIDAGVGLSLLRERLKVGLDIKKPRDNSVKFAVGTEYRRALKGNYRYALRGGYNSSNTDSNGTGFSLGGGLGMKQFDFDFAWVPFEDLGNTFRYAAHIKF